MSLKQKNMKWFVYKFVGKGVPLFSLDSIIFLIDIATWGVYPIFKHTQTTFYSDIYIYIPFHPQEI